MIFIYFYLNKNKGGRVLYINHTRGKKNNFYLKNNFILSKP
jgi:hypothetical protein